MLGESELRRQAEELRERIAEKNAAALEANRQAAALQTELAAVECQLCSLLMDVRLPPACPPDWDVDGSYDDAFHTHDPCGCRVEGEEEQYVVFQPGVTS